MDTLSGVFGEGLEADRLEVAGHRFAQLARRTRLVLEHLVHDHCRCAPERRLPGEHLVERRSQGILVGPGVDLHLSPCLFGAHVAGRIDDCTLGDRAGRIGNECQAEIDDPRPRPVAGSTRMFAGFMSRWIKPAACAAASPSAA